jgi:hypothetical protein
MMRIILGSAIGGVVAGGIALLAASQFHGASASTLLAAPVTAAVPHAAPSLHCAPHEEVVAVRVRINGEDAATLACVARSAAAAAPPAMAAISSPALSPVATMNGWAPESAPVAPPVVHARPAAQRVVYREDDVVRYEPAARKPQRSTAKTVLVIGGGAGAGAGIGALAGGKKGALIGAAIGGGAASIYEATKR